MSKSVAKGVRVQPGDLCLLTAALDRLIDAVERKAAALAQPAGGVCGVRVLRPAQ